MEDEFMADNEEVVEETAQETSSPAVSNTEIDQTKAFAKRLKESTEKARREERESIAKSFGFENWDSYIEDQTRDKLINNGLDPDTVKPILKDLLYSSPEYQEALKFKAEKEALEKELFVKNSIEKLNSVFGTKYNSIDEFDSDTITMWNNGVSLEKAYAANNWKKIQENAIKKVNPIKGSKEHLTAVNGGGDSKQLKEPTLDEIRMFRAINPRITDDEIKKFLNRG